MVRRMTHNSSETMSAPDFRHVDTWIFDLDHTLYSMDSGLHAAVEQRICLFVQRHFGLEREPAFALQKKYLREMGSTLGGLVAHHGVDADAYHDFVNDVVELKLEENGALRAALKRLPGRRFVFTNNCGRFGVKVTAALGVADLFDDIVDAKILNFVPKPTPAAYDALVARGKFEPKTAVLFDDSARNLVPARMLGMTTVWLNDGRGQSYWDADKAHIDYETDDLVRFLQSIRVSA